MIKRRQTSKHLFPGYRVFIYGQEVTEDVLGVVVNWSTGRNLSTCTITLSNERDKYLMTAADIAALASRGLIDGVTLNPGDTVNSLASSFIEDHLIALGEQLSVPVEEEGTFSNPTAEVLAQIAEDSEFSVTDTTSIKNKVVSHKLGRRANIVETQERLQYYDFIEGRECFHPNDPVRVFFKEPDPDIKDPNTGDIAWYYAFSGFVSTLGETEDPKGTKIITLTCEDSMKNLRYSMIIPNIAIFDAPALRALVDRIPQLQQVPTILANPISGLNFTDGVEAVIFGTKTERTTIPILDKDGKEKDVGILIDGVGRFDVNRIVFERFAGEDGITLPDWLTQNTNLVQLNDLKTMANSFSSRSFVGTVPTIEEVIDVIGSDPFDQYPVEGTLRMLVPNEDNFSIDNQVLTQEINELIGNTLKLLDRLSMLYALVTRVGFELYAHPKGDIVIEFPLFDFYPSDFGEKNLRDLIIFNEVSERIDTTYADQNLATAYLATPVLGIRLGESGQPAPIGNLLPQAEILERLIPLYGIRIERGDMDGALTTNSAALAWAKIALRKINSSIFTTSVPTALNPRLWLNRPHLWEARNHVGTALKITHTIQWGSNASSQVGLAYMRGWKGQLLEDGVPLYEPIGGRVSAPLNYRDLFFVPEVPRQ